MGHNLVIVESPAKANTIQKFLGKEFTVKPSFGHIRDLQDKKLSVDVEHGFTPEYVVPSDKTKVVGELKKLSKEADSVWLASDEDREGEAISWHLTQVLGLDPGTTRRIVFHEITKTAIQNAIQNPRTIDMRLVDAQQARRVLDRLVGFELSPILWRKIQPKLSAGRVQSVALRLVTDREKEIMEFKRTPYYKVDATFHPDGTPSSTTVKATLETRMSDLDEASKFLSDNIGASFSIASMEKKEGSRTPGAPFTTSTLQQEAARVLHFPVSRTMSIAQQLYERGLITYMRTDSVNLSSLAITTTKEYITNNFGEQYSKVRQYHTRSKGAQEAHEAIRPTFVANTEIEGTEQEQKLYGLIWRRTVACQMADARVLSTKIAISSDRRKEKFIASATQILFDGFMKIYDAKQEEDGTVLPELHDGQAMTAKDFSAGCKFTAPAARYSEATLVKKLEELGIGRPSTYAPTISTLTTGRGYIVKGNKDGEKVTVTNLKMTGDNLTEEVATEVVGAEKGKLLPQEIGMIVSDYLVKNFSEVMDYNFTADVEKDFDSIAEGEMEWSDVIGRFYTPFHKRVSEVLEDKQYSHVEREIGIDPKDGRKIIAKFGQYGPYVQKGEGDDKKYASLSNGQLIENLTLEDALKLFELPRIVGQIDGVDVVAMKGRFGPYIKCGDTNASIPRGSDPMTITLDECKELIAKRKDKTSDIISEFGDIQVISGRYGPYVKCNGSNYKIPKGTDANALTEEQCKELIANSNPTQHRRSYKKSAAKK